MKKLFSILLLMIGIISLTACSNSRDAGKTTKAASETMVPTLFSMVMVQVPMPRTKWLNQQ